jgi:peptidoglycan/LPS O-acetylase OafA/YrhL
MFFILSGFLITSILVREMAKTSRVSFKKFYLRRTYRIWPAFYTFLAAIIVMTLLGWMQVTPWEFTASGLFIWDYAPNVSTWWLGHTWSLAIEEQFYLLWPLALLLLKPRRALWVALAGIVVVPFLRFGTYLLGNEVVQDRTWHMFHARADSLLIGCALALILFLYPQVWERLTAAANRWYVIVGAALVVLASQALVQKFGRVWQLSLGFTVESLAFGVILVAAIAAGGWLGRILSWRALTYIGVISFSVYLWQQVFLTPLNTTFLGYPPVALVAPFVIGAASYHFVEKPFLRLKRRFETAGVVTHPETEDRTAA